MNSQSVFIEIGQWKVNLIQNGNGTLTICPYCPSQKVTQCIDINVKYDLEVELYGQNIPNPLKHHCLDAELEKEIHEALYGGTPEENNKTINEYEENMFGHPNPSMYGEDGR